MRPAFSIGILLLLCAWCAAAAGQAELVQADLLADVSAIRPGTPFTLGVWLHIAPRWHVYWTNPGDSGLATRVILHLPGGFVAGPTEFPVPRRLEAPGDVVNYGYEDQVLLLTKVTPPAHVERGSPIAIGADVRWLVCKKVCIPGSARLRIELPVSDKPAAANQSLFGQWRAQIPTMTRSADVERVTGGLESHTSARLTIIWKSPARNVELFPGPSHAIQVSNVSVKNDVRQTEITFQTVRLPGQTIHQSSYPVVIGYTDSSGNRRGFVRELPVDRIGIMSRQD